MGKNSIENVVKEVASYHFHVPKGWINDPNGVIYFENKYRIFFQYNPYETYWNNISIGVAESDDLLKFENFNVALAPTKDVNGIFSGSVTRDNDGLYLIFTKHVENMFLRRESISKSFSQNAVNFHTDFKEIVDEKTLPEFDSENFRDPFIYREDGVNYLFIASKDKEENLGKIIVLKSDNLNEFKYAFEIGPLEVFGEMVECPAVGKLGDEYILIYSYITQRKDGKTTHLNGYLLLDMDLENSNYSILKHGAIDNAIDFYAPQLFATKDNELGMISWLNSYDYDPIEHKYDLPTCGIYSYPRILEIENGELIQKPYKEILKRVKKQYHYCEKEFPVKSMLKIQANGEFKIEFKGSENVEPVELLFYKSKLYLKFNDIVSESIKSFSDELTLLILLDYTSFEVFINLGKETLSRRVFFGSDSISIKITNPENIKNMIIAELDI